jgi:L-lactate dehydrogenase complex protein LldG
VTAASLTEKEKILARIREALQTTAPGPGHGTEGDSQTPNQARAWLPAVGSSHDERLQLFQKMATVLKAEVHVVNDLSGAIQVLNNLKLSGHWKKCGIHAGELTSAIEPSLALPLCRTDQAYSATDLESCDVGISECDALIAQTGSVLITSRSAGGRALSVLPPHHVVLARREQLIPDLVEAFALLAKKYSADYPSFISLITGPSRTGDIERILVLGAHGPKKLTIVLIV